MKYQYSYEILNITELQELSDLLKLVFNRENEYSINKTNWMYNNNHSLVLVAKYNDQIIASRGGVFWPLRLNDTTINGVQFGGTCVHPQHRRKGLFSALTKKYLNLASQYNLECIYNVSVKASRIGYEKLGWEYHNGFHRLTYVNKPWRFIKKPLARTIPLEHNNVMNQVENIPAFFYEARQNHFKDLIHTDYDMNFLKWRLNNSGENYRIFQEKEVIIIYKILIIANIKHLLIGEFFMSKKSRTTFSKALKKVIKLENPDISYTYISRNHPYFIYYLYSFFLPNPLNYNLNFGTRFLSEEIQKNLSNKKWASCTLDLDTF